jgi:hypothetical protein
MADRYWVGGTGTWDATTTTNWAATSGGAGGESAPTSADNAYFDGSSDSGAPFTVTLSGSPVCADLIIGDGSTVTALDQTMTLAGSGAFDVYGSLYFPATNLTRTFLGRITFAATSGSYTVTTNGVSLSLASGTVNEAVVFGPASASTATWTLGSALTILTGGVYTASGTFDTGNYNITHGTLGFRSTQSKTINLGSSTITSSSVNTTFFTSSASPSNTTLNAGTSTIIGSGANSTLNSGLTSSGLIFYNVSFTSAAAGTVTINGANTFNDLTFTSRSATGIRAITFGDNQTVSGALTFGTANTAIRRMFVQSSAIGTQRTLTLNGTLAALADIDFRDINAAGTVATPWTGTRLGNALGNSNITFDASKNCFRVGTGNWTATQWSLTSGGSLDVNNFPLAQDTMVFDTNTATGTHTIDAAGWNLGSLDCSALNVAVTIASGTTAPAFYGSIVLDSDITLTGTGILNFNGQGVTQTITSAGKTFTQPITINSPSGTLQLQDNTTTTNTVTLTSGTLDLNDFDLTCNIFSSSNANTRSIAFGTGSINTVGSGTVWTTATPTNFSYTGTPTVNISNNSATATTVTTGAMTEAQSLNFNYTTGTYTLTDTTAVYRSVNFTGFAGTIPNSVRTIFGGLTLSTGMTLTAGANATTFASTSAGNTITSAGKTQDYPLIFNGIGGVWACQDALTQGSTRAFTFINGTVQLKNGVTSTVGAFATSGTNQKFLQSTTPGSQATLSQASGTVNVSYLSIQDINATGGAIWFAPIDQLNVDVSNNDGWDFFVQLGQYMYTRRKNKRLLIS